jgi:methionyl-tRNA synthetase
MPLGSDAIFSYDRFLERFNVDLANDLGNLVSRSISMINKYLGGVVKKPLKTYSQFDQSVEDLSQEVINKYKSNFDNFLFQNGLNEVWTLISRANKYIDETTPWSLAKDEGRLDELASVMYHLYEVLRLVAIMIAPVMTEASRVILDELGIANQNINDLGFGQTMTGKVIVNPIILFKRLDLVEEMKKHERN